MWRRTARRFVAEGAKVHLVGLDEGRLEGAVQELGAASGLTVADVTDEPAVQQASRAAVDRFGPLDVHVTGAFHVIKHGLPRMNDGGSTSSATRARTRSPRGSSTSPATKRLHHPYDPGVDGGLAG
jgi:NAD(P)-dependent dehydrogenase (short-subunit alcohol dehydrogenase family)